MAWLPHVAVFFLIWWLALFVSLPFGLRTQDDEGEVVLGTTSSAPGGRHMARVIVRTTILAGLIYLAYYLLIYVLEFSVDSLPQVVPDF